MRIVSLAFVTGVAFLTSGPFAFSADVQQTDVYAAETVQPVRRHFWSGDWYLKVGAAGLVAPKFEGSNKYRFSAQPLISLGRQGEATRFSSRNDNVSFALIDNDRFRAGIAGKLLWGGDNDIHGLKDDKFGGEVGGFVDVYPTDWLRVRGEVRQGIWAHKGVVADIAADAFYDVTPAIRVSGGPRATFASKDYFKTYYGVDAEEAVASGLSEYHPGSGFKSVGVGGAITWKATDKIDTSLFGEYSRLQGSAKDSSIVKERGSPDQFMVGVSATYRFDFSLE
ncbi:outer membrane scaffolding protein for murein synthesis (MipA/OmpV family) [Ochrobactrum daejeonense]|uniref:Outer membrane scaffolding protein for murein synthesis (MipA/OmpV family) n=1 Tax=Brucella daejeonensis TaxID=659015 RepID=A0A7W9AV81_9HYPH|nr:outer membrane scaffolding protein for murein synthesis (MipA/OmpV family) [Brucella daejeonensis]